MVKGDVPTIRFNPELKLIEAKIKHRYKLKKLKREVKFRLIHRLCVLYVQSIFGESSIEIIFNVLSILNYCKGDYVKL